MPRPWETGFTPSTSTATLSGPVTTPGVSLVDVEAAPSRWARARLLAALWLSEKTTITGGLSAASLLGGWVIAPTKLEAIAVLVAMVSSGYLIIFKEKRT